ncbi:hypothetical protein PsorP6_013908 [Peronosclerospora sorghi]|uniref:Uncharacterized protein n=1 Tax=Peronosclerospora sorghi TaxID=230839 RepID=A0ACC0VIW2_9STRA|nr:hypothetical protein PsorP6_013908 [Peronosclerospora sorghi]
MKRSLNTHEKEDRMNKRNHQTDLDDICTPLATFFVSLSDKLPFHVNNSLRLADKMVPKTRSFFSKRSVLPLPGLTK